MREERSIGYVDDMDELRRELVENDPSPSMDGTVGQQYEVEELDGQNNS